MFRPEQSGRLLETNKISTSSALYTCNLQLTMCSSPPAAHLAQVTGLVPSGAAERSEAVKPGDLFHAVDGKDVTSLTDAQVAALCFGTPNTPLTLTLCGKAPPSQGKLYQAARSGNIMETKALLAAGAEADGYLDECRTLLQVFG